MIESLSIAIHAFVSRVSMSFFFFKDKKFEFNKFKLFISDYAAVLFFYIINWQILGFKVFIKNYLKFFKFELF